MKKSLMFFLTLTVLFMFQHLDAGKVNVTGKWQITTESPRGERTRDIEFVQDGENLKVIMEGRQGNTIEGKGTVKDNKIEWTITHETPRGTFTMTYKGTVDGDTMKGDVAMGGRGSRNWSATRKKS
jgi:hypothetical protein